MLVIFFYNLFEYIYACPIYVQNMKKIEGQFCYPIHPIPSHPEVKHFQDFKKANFRLLIVSVKHPSLDTIKWKKYQMDPIRDLLSKVPSGDIALCKMLAHATTNKSAPFWSKIFTSPVWLLWCIFKSDYVSNIALLLMNDVLQLDFKTTEKNLNTTLFVYYKYFTVNG